MPSWSFPAENLTRRKNIHLLLQIIRELNRENIKMILFGVPNEEMRDEFSRLSGQPSLRAYGSAEAEAMLQYPEFDVPVTIASRQRRLSYIAQIQRERVEQSAGPNNLEFVRQCQMRLEISRPADEAAILHCWELCQRYNQFNLTTRRHTQA
jgi:predicted enzyme involved in methoxymalonyl-ACP biosynthesis